MMGRNRASFGGSKYTTNGSSGYKEKHSLQERRMLRVSFEQIKDYDMFGLKKSFPDPRDDQFLRTFYTVCSIIPISFILALLFYMLWFVSP